MMTFLHPLQRVLLSSTLLCGALPSLALAAPQGSAIAAGSVAVTTNGASTVIQQTTDRAAIDWKSFDVKANESVIFKQPSAASVTLNKIHDQKPSEIFGTVLANGQLILSNPNGMIFAKGSSIDVAGLVATSADIATSAFMNNAVLNFGGAGNTSGKIINNGAITAKDAGLIALIAPQVENNGFIGARLGKIQLAGADTFTIDLYGDGLINMAVKDDALTTAVTNTGILRAHAGSILLSAAQAEHVLSSTINLTGTVDVSASHTDANGTVVFGNGAGGNVAIAGDHIALRPDARVLASGPNGGGQVLIGGGYQGSGTLPWAKTIQMDSGARIAANATKKGNGGEVVLWSRDQTLFGGSINARGGRKGGNGGLVETSSKNALGVSGLVDASAPKGAAGDWLLDPTNITITQAGGTNITSGACGAGPYACADISVSANSIQTALGVNNVTIRATGDITLSTASITKNSASNQVLTLRADGSILTSGTNSITGAGAGKLDVILWADGEAVPNNDGYISLSNLTITSNNGDVILGGGLDDGADQLALDAITVLYDGVAGDGRPDNYAWGNGVVDDGIRLGGNITTGTGNFVALGHGKIDATTTQHVGVQLSNETLQSTTGTIKIFGRGGNSITDSYGVSLGAPNTISSTTGSITIDGRAGTGSDFLYGIGYFGASLSTQGGDINLSGAGGTGTGHDSYGVFIATGNILSATGAGNINVTGNGGSGSYSQRGISVTAQFTTDQGDIIFNGTGGAGTDANHGISINTSTFTTGTGDISFTGRGGGAGNTHGFSAAAATINSTNGGTITIIGSNSTGTGKDINIAPAGTAAIGSSTAGDITLTGNSLAITATTTIQTPTNLTIKPFSEPTSIGISGGTCGGTCSLNITDTILAMLSPDVDGNGTGSLIIGDSTDATGTVDVAGWDISGKTYDVEVYGGLVDFTTGDVVWNHDNSLLFNSRANDIQIDRNFTRNANTAGDGTLTLKASGSITTSGSHTITAATGATSGKLATILWSDAEAVPNNDGYIALTNLAITSNNGDVIIGGGLDNGADIVDLDGSILHNGIAADGRPDGVAFGNGTLDIGVRLNNADMTTGTGNIIVKGHGRNVAGNTHNGLNIYNGSQLLTTTGTILLNGTGGAGGNGNVGINIQDGTTSLSTGDGSIIMVGRGGNGTGKQNYGLTINNDADIISNGTVAGPGSIKLYGQGGTGGTQENYGINIRNTGTLISADQHDIFIDGRAANNAGIWAIGFSLTSGADITSVGTGNNAGKITISGTGAVGTDQGYGVDIDTSGTSVNAVDGDITITGVGGAGAGTGNHGIDLETGADIYSTGDSIISLTGTRGDTNAATYDISITGATVEIGGASDTGDININANTLAFANHDIRTDANILIKPRTAGSSIGISAGTCGATCVLNINDTSLANLHADDDANGTGSLIIGDSAAGTGVVDINGWNLAGLGYDVEVYGGTVDFTGAMAWNGANDLTFTSRTGSLDIDQGFIKSGGAVSNVRFNAAGAITQTSAITSTTGALNLILDSDIDAAGNEPVTLNANTTSNGGNITYNDAAVLGGNVALSSGTGNITFSGTLNGAHDLGITATTGDIVFSGIAGGTTPLANVTVTGADAVTSTTFSAASYTQTASTGAATFNNGGLVTTGDIGIATTGDILGKYSGINGSLHSGGAVNATVTFNTLDINGTSAALLPGLIGAAAPVDQTMANRISINGIAPPALVVSPAYTFAGFTIGAFAAPVGGGGGSSVRGTLPGHGSSGGSIGSGNGSMEGGNGSQSGNHGGYDGSIPLPVYFQTVLGTSLFNTEAIAKNQISGDIFSNIFNSDLGQVQDFELLVSLNDAYSMNLNERDLEKEMNKRRKGTSAGGKAKKTDNVLYLFSPSLWHMLNSN